MEALQARINSFKKSKRVKNPSKPSSTTTLKWPHPKEFRANPESLAEAGFYYDPSYDDPDNVTCYVCDKELGGWEEDDDPFLIHWTKCGQTCCWANVRCGLMTDLDRKGRFVSSDKTRIPTHKSMEKARCETFFTGKGWIHDKIPNHGANSKMMARAGLVYTPQHSGDDLATCFYCNTSLSGWDAEDDPLEEHRKRDNKVGFPCPFFSTSSTEIASSAKPVSRAPSMKPPSKSQGKPPSRSVSRSKHQDIVEPTKNFDGELDEDSDGLLVEKTQAVTKTPRNGRTTSSSDARKSSAKTPGNKTRSSSRTGLKNVAEEEDDDEDETDAPIEPEPPVEKKSRSRSKSVARKTVAQPELNEDEPETRKPSRSRSKKVVSDAEEEPARKPSRSRAKAAPPTEDEAPPKKSRAKSKSKAVESEQEEIPQTTTKPKIAPRSKSKAPVHKFDPESEQEVEPQILRVTTTKKKSSAKSKVIPPPAPQELFDDDVFTDQYVPPSVPLPPDLKDTEIPELPPLFIPKRNAANKVPSSGNALETVPVEKEKKKPGRPKNKPPPPPRSRHSEDEPVETEPPSSTDTKPLAPVSTNPSIDRPSKEKVVGKAKTNNQKMKVVEISSDEEPEEKEVLVIPQQDKENSRTIPKSQLLAVPTPQNPVAQPPPPPKPAAAQTKREKKQVTVETVQPISTPSPLPPPDNPDVSMASIEPENEASENVPVTPPRSVAKTPPQIEVERATTPEANSVSAEQLFIPALSKLPFTPLHTLTEPELDMTVEEWIRYQMDVEFDKFRRDGERELQRFRKRAEEVRKVIEGL